MFAAFLANDGKPSACLAYTESASIMPFPAIMLGTANNMYGIGIINNSLNFTFLCTNKYKITGKKNIVWNFIAKAVPTSQRAALNLSLKIKYRPNNIAEVYIMSHWQNTTPLKTTVGINRLITPINIETLFLILAMSLANK